MGDFHEMNVLGIRTNNSEIGRKTKLENGYTYKK
jgi:hypothetical protein